MLHIIPRPKGRKPPAEHQFVPVSIPELVADVMEQLKRIPEVASAAMLSSIAAELSQCAVALVAALEGRRVFQAISYSAKWYAHDGQRVYELRRRLVHAGAGQTEPAPADSTQEAETSEFPAEQETPTAVLGIELTP